MLAQSVLQDHPGFGAEANAPFAGPRRHCLADVDRRFYDALSGRRPIPFNQWSVKFERAVVVNRVDARRNKSVLRREWSETTF